MLTFKGKNTAMKRSSDMKTSNQTEIIPAVIYIKLIIRQNKSDETKIWKVSLVLSATVNKRTTLSVIARNVNKDMKTEALREPCRMTIMIGVFDTN